MTLNLAFLLSLLFSQPASAPQPALHHQSAAVVGDSLAVGLGGAAHLPTFARVGASSCVIVGMVPRSYYSVVFVSAGTNDPPGRCLDKIRARIRAGKIIWILPVNSARRNVVRFAASHGDSTLNYVPSVKNWPHPDSYEPMARLARAEVE